MRHVTGINPPTHEPNVAAVKVNEALLSDMPIQHEDNASNASVRNQLKTVDKQVGVWELKNGLNDTEMAEAEQSRDGTPSQQATFMKEVETFYRENALEFKALKFYGEPLNCHKLWRAVTRLGGYDVVRVQSDSAGRLVITGQPEQIDNPWGITPFKKVVSLPGKIDPLQTSPAWAVIRACSF